MDLVIDNEEKKQKIIKYFQRVYRNWINEIGVVRPQKEFADFLELEKVRFNRYYNGSRTEIDYQTALAICKKTHDYELLKILEYPIPESADIELLSSLPDDIAGEMRAAITEINSIYAERGITGDTDEARSVAYEVLSRHGFTRKE